MRLRRSPGGRCAESCALSIRPQDRDAQVSHAKSAVHILLPLECVHGSPLYKQPHSSTPYRPLHHDISSQQAHRLDLSSHNPKLQGQPSNRLPAHHTNFHASNLTQPIQCYPAQKKRRVQALTSGHHLDTSISKSPTPFASPCHPRRNPGQTAAR
jgi:hypothetical protein